MLTADAHRPKKERRTVRALYGELRQLGYSGGSTRLTDFIRVWHVEQGLSSARGAFVSLAFALADRADAAR